MFKKRIIRIVANTTIFLYNKCGDLNEKKNFSWNEWWSRFKCIGNITSRTRI